MAAPAFPTFASSATTFSFCCSSVSGWPGFPMRIFWVIRTIVAPAAWIMAKALPQSIEESCCLSPTRTSLSTPIAALIW